MITLSHLYKSYPPNNNFVVYDVSLKIHEGETLVLLGSSGCGKTTLLKMINRQLQPTRGEIKINDCNLNRYSISELRTLFGYVFQGIGLFPHMTVARNISIVLELMKIPLAERNCRADELLELVGLKSQEYANRYPDELSGGQQQRIGVARALAANPHCLLMDEPFGALDAITRNTLQNEIMELNSKLHKTIVFVTHDILEAFKIADRIAVMHQGHVEQIGNKEELIRQPKTAFVKNLINEQLQYLSGSIR